MTTFVFSKKSRSQNAVVFKTYQIGKENIFYVGSLLWVIKIFKALDNMRQKKKAGQTCKKSLRPKVSLLFTESKVLRLASSDDITKGLIPL